MPLLRGFLSGSRWLAVGIATLVAVVCAGGIRLLEPWLDDYLVLPLYLACAMLPAYALASVQDGIARSYDWIGLAMVPTYIVRQFVLTVLMAAAYFGGMPMNAVTAMIVCGLSYWLPTHGAAVDHERPVRRSAFAPGPKAHEFKVWFLTSLPILLVEGFYLLLTYTDILVLQQFRPPDEVAVYYAAAKTLVLVSFIYYAVSATTAHRFSVYHVAGDREGLTAFIAQSIKLDVLALARSDGAAPDFRKAAALAVRRAVHRRLSPDVHSRGRPVGARGDRADRAAAQHARRAARVRDRLWQRLHSQLRPLRHPDSDLRNSAGAAIATTVSLVIETIALFVVTKERLGFHVFIWRRAER